ncbi:MAG: asparagine synthase (glutamine-hydrolyzing) [Acidobacteria bacterium]|nr:asparagine synthase (glutamine-hydrolyzing) [Acidobacteriota bacterium]
MCGFAGIWHTRLSGRELTACAARMIAPIVHRGPDDSGTWTDAGAGVAIGFRRLAILDLSPAGRQPMASASGRYVVAFNGEVYNFMSLRRDLEARGYRFRSRSDTEVILAAFEEWGVHEGVSRLIGMFAMAVWDIRRRELALLRDRLGKKPLYVHRGEGFVAFGSEMKALAAGPSFDTALDEGALGAYLRYLYIPAPRTILRSTRKVPAGHIQVVTDPAGPMPPPRCYWSVRGAALAGLANPHPGGAGEIVEELDALLADAVRCRLQSDVPVGALLSGGVDSSTIVALMRETSSGATRTFTVGFDERDFDESPHAARVAAHLGAEHTGLLVTGADACRVVPRLAEIFDEPLADPSQIPTLLVSQLARRHVTVALCGDGGDELFGGYNRYVYGSRIFPRLTRIPRPVRQATAAALGCIPARAWNAPQRLASRMPIGLPCQRLGERVRKLQRVMVCAGVGDMYQSLLSASDRPPLAASPQAGIGDDDVNARILEDREPADLLDRMMLADQSVYLPDDLLAKLDRASMAVSLEVRAPLLDHRVVELSWRLPRSMKLRGSVGKWALRQVLYRRVPPALVERPKMGFSVPIDAWLRGPLREWAQDLLFCTGRRGNRLHPPAVARLWTSLQNGRESAGLAVWSLVMFQAWQSRWLR